MGQKGRPKGFKPQQRVSPLNIPIQVKKAELVSAGTDTPDWVKDAGLNEPPFFVKEVEQVRTQPTNTQNMSETQVMEAPKSEKVKDNVNINVAAKVKTYNDKSKSLKAMTIVLPIHKHSSATTFIPKEDIITVKVEDKKTGEKHLTQKAIRYIKGASSLFVEDQEGMSADHIYIEVSGSQLTIDENEILLQEYLSICNHNGSNKNRNPKAGVHFTVQDLEAETKKKMEQMNVEEDAILLFRQLDSNDLSRIAKSIPSIKGNLHTWGANELKYNMQQYVRNFPKEFIRLKDDPATDINAYLEDAISFKILDTNTRNRVLWGDTKNLITEVPIGTDAVDFMCNWIMSGEGKEVYKEVVKRVNKEVYKN